MTIRVFENPVEAAAAVAHRLIDAIRAKPSLTLGLPAGRTPIPAYAELRRLNRQGAISLAGTRTFNLDEFVGLRADDPRSFRHFMEANLFEGTDLPPASIEFLDDRALFTYYAGPPAGGDGTAAPRWSLKLKAVPLEWFYQ